tara:strand:+ start:433 stop:726 length:294 start_codon:yes stop_codon:yes gene_type:complete
MSLLFNEGTKLIKGTRDFLREKLHDTMVRNSVFAAIVFLIVGHPATFRFVDNIVKINNPDTLVLFHAVVFAFIMYFGSIYIFTPIHDALLTEGVRNK